MLKTKSLVVYKNKAAIVKGIDEKITITLPDKSEVRVRDKDISLLYPGPVENFAETQAGFSPESARELWELVRDENEFFHLEDIASLAEGGFTAKNAWASYLLLKDNLYFEGSIQAIKAKSTADVEIEEKKRRIKQGEETERVAFLERLKQGKLDLRGRKSPLQAELSKSGFPDTDSLSGFETGGDERFLQDVEALALGKSERSKTLRDAGLSEDPLSAHKLLLETGFWDKTVNPHPARYGVLTSTSKFRIDPPAADEERVDLRHLAAYAIDDEGSADPDDAVSLEKTAEGTFLYVHVADPAASVGPGTEVDIDARARGATLYAPEGTTRMLPEDALGLFALGLSENSPALSFKMKLGPDYSIEKTEIFRSTVKVKRLTYRAADGENELAPFFTLADENIKRRAAAGAAQIDFPEVSISAKNGLVEISPVVPYRSKILVRECMLLAGEGAANWALEQRLAFPFISQESDNIPEKIPGGYAGAYQLRRSMRARLLTTKPALHQGLGIDIYTQVTSPLRRYTDLLAHQQIRAFLRGEKALAEDEILARLAASECSASAVNRAERASRAHWTAVYLSDKKGTEWDAVVLDKRGAHIIALIPLLGIETQTTPPRGAVFAPNDGIKLKLASVRIPECEINWVAL
ncbi:MAG: RNB domain-containing ribonuclease [Spirochaetaceae bacterium]|jgi:exoribonuclease-2|nr:RNB domain-containing ribonuclease [Spirochaetaceae bacterium]